MNCLGKLSRDSGHMRVPDPPHMITGMILVMHSPGWRAPFAIASRALFFCNNARDKAMPDALGQTNAPQAAAAIRPVVGEA
jgi:hypothetical protein